MEKINKNELDSMTKGLFTLMISTGSEELMNELLHVNNESKGISECQKNYQFEMISCH